MKRNRSKTSLKDNDNPKLKVKTDDEKTALTSLTSTCNYLNPFPVDVWMLIINNLLIYKNPLTIPLDDENYIKTSKTLDGLVKKLPFISIFLLTDNYCKINLANRFLTFKQLVLIMRNVLMINKTIYNSFECNHVIKLYGTIIETVGFFDSDKKDVFFKKPEWKTMSILPRLLSNSSEGEEKAQNKKNMEKMAIDIRKIVNKKLLLARKIESELKITKN